MKPPIVHPEDVWLDGAVSSEVFLMDIRMPAEFEEAHIPGSANVPLSEVDQHFEEIRRRSSRQKIAIVCQTWVRSKAIYDKLHQRGIEDLHILDGGMRAWMQKGLPVERGEKKAVSLERQVRIAAGALVVLGVALGTTVSAWFLLLSGFVGAGLVYSGVTDTCTMALVLAKMPFNR